MFMFAETEEIHKRVACASSGGLPGCDQFLDYAGWQVEEAPDKVGFYWLISGGFVLVSSVSLQFIWRPGGIA